MKALVAWLKIRTRITLKKVKGHSEIEDNKADRLANLEARKSI